MKSFVRLSLLLVIAVLAFGGVFAVNAQDAAQSCYTLAQADCDLFYGSQKPEKLLGLIAGFEMNYKFSLKGSATTDGNKQDFDIKADGKGGFGLDMAKMQSANSSDPLAALGGILFSNTINGEISGAGMPAPMKGTIELRIVDGKLYFNAGAMTQDKWQYVEFSELSAALQGLMSSMSAGGNNPLSSIQGAAGAATNPAQAEALTKAFNESGALVTEAADGPTIDGKATRKITFRLDLGKMADSPELMKAVMDAVKQQNNPQTANLTEDQMKAVLKGINGSMYWDIAKDTGAAQGWGFSFALKFDADMIQAMGSNGAVDMTMDFGIELGKIGQPVKVDAPADATKLPLGGM